MLDSAALQVFALLFGQKMKPQVLTTGLFSVQAISIATVDHTHHLKTINMVRDLLVFNQEGLKDDEIEISGVIRYNMTLRKGIVCFLFS